MRIDPEITREIHARVDIAGFIGSYVQLQKRGRDLVGLCPFHSERTPSFHVHPEQGYFKCFGCGVAGDVIAFLERLENLTFPDAVRVLAKRAGIEVEPENPQAARARGEKETIYEANRVATAFFARCLAGPAGTAAMAYCEGRGISAASIERFSLGYAPESWDALVNELRAAGIDLNGAEKAGLIKPRQSGGFYDFYRNRLMIPTYSTTGEIIAFMSREMIGVPMGRSMIAFIPRGPSVPRTARAILATPRPSAWRASSSCNMMLGMVWISLVLQWDECDSHATAPYP